MSVVAIVGRPNVGKSTLFNRLLGRTHALVEDFPGVTRDRNYATAVIDGKKLTLIDTGGLEPESEDQLLSLMAFQVEQAVGEADLILFVVDVREGLLPQDAEIATFLRKREKDVILVVNKVDTDKLESSASEFYALGFSSLFTISAEHKRGTYDLADEILTRIDDDVDEETASEEIRISILGRPNAGKSSLVNKLIGFERVIVSPIAGTTRDVIDTAIEYEGKRYILIDTAGIRRKSKISADIERWSSMRAIKTIDRSHVCILLIDAVEGLTDQEMRILDLIMRGGRPVLICLNKWDLVAKDTKTFDTVKKDMEFKLGNYRHVPVISISALTGQRATRVFEFVDKLYANWTKRVPTSKLNDSLIEAMRQNPMPIVGSKRTRIYYATQVASCPPVLALFSSYPEGIPSNYEKYLQNWFREHFDFEGVPIRLLFKKRRDDLTGQ